MLTAIAVLALAPRDLVELRPGGRRPHPLFNDDEYVGELNRSRRTCQTAYLNGRATKVVLPGTYDLDDQQWNRAGRTIGSFSYVAGMLHHEAYVTGFATSRGRLELLPFDPSAIDDAGRVVGVTIAPDDPLMADPNDVKLMPRGVLWDHGRLVQLGPATKVWFGPKREIRGYYEVDRSGKRVYGAPLILTVDPALVRYRTFVWSAGRRKELATVAAEPTVPVNR
jgi:hypothetical protein